MKSTNVNEVHDDIMADLDQEWTVYHARHTSRRKQLSGIRSSQISTLVMYLIRKGVIK